MKTGGAFEGVVEDTKSPFGYKRGEGIDAGFGEHDWICNRDRARTDLMFDALNPIDGKITGAGELQMTSIQFFVNFYLIYSIYLCVCVCSGSNSRKNGIDQIQTSEFGAEQNMEIGRLQC